MANVEDPDPVDPMLVERRHWIDISEDSQRPDRNLLVTNSEAKECVDACSGNSLRNFGMGLFYILEMFAPAEICSGRIYAAEFLLVMSLCESAVTFASKMIEDIAVEGYLLQD
ncbi:hypothetical protein NPIL_113751 [Nephila pilipes]|uniref:Uncharacterized protein n=1 Tax=Nephila pilipes TaxID=299642 RepID=A0A8X6UV02_NEPPI|nr:hypothetical protein NPIL_113751 [Nephila pilipes]